MPSPNDLLKKVKSLVSKSPKQPAPARTPKRWEWLAFFSELAESSGLKKANKLDWAASDKKRRALVEQAAGNSVLETLAFIMCGMYYVMHPRNPRLAKGIHQVFLRPEAEFSLNLNAGTFAEVEKLAQWGGYNDISAMLDSAAEGLTGGSDPAIGSFREQMKRPVGASSAKMAKYNKETIAQQLLANGWSQSDLRAISLL